MLWPQVPGHLSASVLTVPLLHREGQENDPPDLAGQSRIGHALGHVDQGEGGDKNIR